MNFSKIMQALAIGGMYLTFSDALHVHVQNSSGALPAAA